MGRLSMEAVALNAGLIVGVDVWRDVSKKSLQPEFKTHEMERKYYTTLNKLLENN